MSAINVNLEPCDGILCHNDKRTGQRHHDAVCSTQRPPVLIPCLIPRSVTFQVILSPGCYCERLGIDADPHHVPNCPARPIHVTCSIGGEAWAESRVEDAERADGPGQPNFTESEHMAAVRACNERWALVKALLLNHPVPATSQAELDLWAQRDAVFSALADMARTRREFSEANNRLPEFCRLFDKGDPTHEALARYVANLIDQVGVLT